MDESKSGRALNSAEKAEADAPDQQAMARYHRRPDGKPPMIVRFR